MLLETILEAWILMFFWSRFSLSFEILTSHDPGKNDLVQLAINLTWHCLLLCNNTSQYNRLLFSLNKHSVKITTFLSFVDALQVIVKSCHVLWNKLCRKRHCVCVCVCECVSVCGVCVCGRGWGMLCRLVPRRPNIPNPSHVLQSVLRILRMVLKQTRKQCTQLIDF